jgi:RimJ/RimL family protein N-acetyltransferase
MVLRPFEASDAASAHGWFGDREVMRFSTNGPDSSLARTRVRVETYREHQRRFGFSKWIALDRKSGRPIGDAGIMHLPGSAEIELGYRFAREWWNHGLATEAGEAWMRHGLQELGIPRLIAFAHQDNVASQRVLDKLDFRFQRMDQMVGMRAAVYSCDHPARYRPPTSQVLETPRLLLREMEIADLDFIASLLADPEVMRYFPACCSREESEEWVRWQQQRYARHGFGFWLAIEKATRRPVGQIGPLLHEIDGQAEIGLGYMLDLSCWGRGLATEAAAASRDYVTDKLGRSRVLCLVRPENDPSRAVAGRLGMVPVSRTDHAGFPHLVFEWPGPGTITGVP